MSIKAMTWAWEQDIPPTQKFVLIALCDASNDAGVCWPSISRICAKTSLKERAVQNAIKWLINAGLIMRNQKKGQASDFQIFIGSEPSVLSENSTENLSTTPAPDAPRTKCTPHNMHPTPAPDAPPPPHLMRDTPAFNAPRTVIEPSYRTVIEPSERARAGATQPKKRNTRLPDDWKLPKAWGDESLAKGFTESEIREESERFRNYWLGTGKTMANWHAVWLNWMDRSRQYRRPGYTQSNGKSLYEQSMEAGRRVKEKLFGKIRPTEKEIDHAGNII